MPRAKLLKRKGAKVPFFSLSPAKLDALRPAGLKATTAERFKPVPLRSLRIPAKELLKVPERIRPTDLVRPERLWCLLYCPPRLRVRKNQKDLTEIEWLRFIHAIEALADPNAPSPNYDDFVDVHHKAMTDHAGHAWGAHTMSGHDGRNFLRLAPRISRQTGGAVAAYQSAGDHPLLELGR